MNVITRSLLVTSLAAWTPACGGGPADVVHHGYTDYYYQVDAVPRHLTLSPGDTAALIVAAELVGAADSWFILGLTAGVIVLDAHTGPFSGWRLDSLFCCVSSDVGSEVVDTLLLAAQMDAQFGTASIEIKGYGGTSGVWLFWESNDVSLSIVSGS